MEIRIEINSITTPQLYQHKEDRDVFGYVRNCAVGGCPAVFVLNEPKLKTKMTKDWQYYLIAINYGMDLVDIAALLDYRLAFANQTGLRNPNKPKRNWIEEKNLNANDDPSLDKDRTCSRNVLTGEVAGETLRIKMFDGNKPPPMKLGKKLPQTIAEIRIEDYLYNPRDNREMFCVANTVSVKEKDNTSVAPFPRGAIYEWTGDNLPYTFIPHVSREIIYYPLQFLIKVPVQDGLPSPYRIYKST